MLRRSAAAVVIGTLNTLTGALMMWGGAQEVRAYAGREAWPVGVGALGFMAGAAFAASGIALLLGHGAARRLVTLGGLSSAAVHAVGVATGLIGAVGLILGVTYPLLAMITVRRQPPAGAASDGSPRDVDAPREHRDPRDHGRPLTATA